MTLESMNFCQGFARNSTERNRHFGRQLKQSARNSCWTVTVMSGMSHRQARGRLIFTGLVLAMISVPALRIVSTPP